MSTPMITLPKTGGLRRQGLFGVVCLLFALCIVLGWGSRSLASDVSREAPVDDPSPQILVLVPLDSPDRLSAALATGLIPYGRYGGSGGEFLLAGVPLAEKGIAMDLGFPVTVLDEDPSGATYYLAVVPPGTSEPDWAAYGRVLWQDVEQALLRATPTEAERLVEAGAEIAQISREPVVVQAEQVATAASAAALLTAPDPMIQGMIDQVMSDTVTKYDRQLSGEVAVTIGDSPYTIASRNTRISSGVPIQKATQFVGEHLAALGYSVEYQNWTQTGDSSRNVIAELPGQTHPDNIFIIGAHVDDMPQSTTAPGADDNASGATAVLIAADIMSQYYWDCTLRFALWTGEEQGLKGSNQYALGAWNAGETIRGNLNLDMLGYNKVAPRTVNLYYKSTPSGSEVIADLFISTVSTYGINLAPVKYNVASYPIGNQSDNASFWARSYPAIMVIEDYQGGDFTPSYHTVNDRFSTLDLDYFTSMVKAAVGTFAHMSGCLISDAPVHVTSSLPGNNAVNLKWYQTAPNSTYEVWRNLTQTNPYFMPGVESELRQTLSASNVGITINYPDAGAAGDPANNHYYLVRGINGSGGVAATSQRIGEFSFALQSATAIH